MHVYYKLILLFILKKAYKYAKGTTPIFTHKVPPNVESSAKRPTEI